MSVEKKFLSANQLLEDSYRLANMVYDSGFRPTHLVGLWRGGAPIGIAVQELLAYRGVETDHIAIRTSAYSNIDQQEPQVKVYALGHLVRTLNPEDHLLIIDDIFDSGRSIKAFLKELSARCRHNMPRSIRIATVYCRPARNSVDLRPDFYVHTTDEWLVFPHEIQGLTDEEIIANKPGASLILRPDLLAKNA